MILFLFKFGHLSDHSVLVDRFHDHLQILKEIVPMEAHKMMELQESLTKVRGEFLILPISEYAMSNSNSVESYTVEDAIASYGLTMSGISLPQSASTNESFLTNEETDEVEVEKDDTEKIVAENINNPEFDSADEKYPDPTLDRLEKLERLLEILIGTMAEENVRQREDLIMDGLNSRKGSMNKILSIQPTIQEVTYTNKIEDSEPLQTGRLEFDFSRVTKYEEIGPKTSDLLSQEPTPLLFETEATGHKSSEINLDMNMETFESEESSSRAETIQNDSELISEAEVNSNILQEIPYKFEPHESKLHGHVVLPITEAEQIEIPSFTSLLTAAQPKTTRRISNRVLTMKNPPNRIKISPQFNFHNNNNRPQSSILYGKPKVAWYGPNAPKVTTQSPTTSSFFFHSYLITSMPTTESVTRYSNLERKPDEDIMDYFRRVFPIVLSELELNLSSEYSTLLNNADNSQRTVIPYLSASLNDSTVQVSAISFVLVSSTDQSIGSNGPVVFPSNGTARITTKNIHTYLLTTRTKLSKANYDQFPLLFNAEREKRRKEASFFHVEKTMENVAVTFVGYSSIVAAVIFAIFVTLL